MWDRGIITSRTLYWREGLIDWQVVEALLGNNSEKNITSPPLVPNSSPNLANVRKTDASIAPVSGADTSRQEAADGQLLITRLAKVTAGMYAVKVYIDGSFVGELEKGGRLSCGLVAVLTPLKSREGYSIAKQHLSLDMALLLILPAIFQIGAGSVAA
jgi:hypothetical protein